MKIEAVTVCVNYSDFLAHTLPHNKNHFERMVIVTDTRDEETKKVCDYYNVMCVQTDAFYDDKGNINKGVGINEGLKHLDMDGWVLHLDADIYLPPLTRSILERIDLDDKTIYGVDRMMCPSYEDWINFMDSPSPLHEGWIFVHADKFPMGTRIAEYKSKGWEPIGFFQLWNPKGSGVNKYPDNHGRIDRSDVIFAKYFERGKRQLIPEIIVIHIDSEKLPQMGKNWNGRKTAKFSLQETLSNRENENLVDSSDKRYPIMESLKNSISEDGGRGYFPTFHWVVKVVIKTILIIVLISLFLLTIL
jgi:hypothetical protein